MPKQQMHGKPKSLKKGLAKLLPYMKPYIVVIGFAILLSIIGALGSLFGPKLLGEITKECQKKVAGLAIDFTYIFKLGVMLICIYSCSAFGNYIASFLLTGVTQKISYRLRKDISEKINRVPLKYFDQSSYGDLLSRVTNDVDSISQNLNQSLVSTFSSVILLIGVFVMMFTIHGKWHSFVLFLYHFP